MNRVPAPTPKPFRTTEPEVTVPEPTPEPAVSVPLEPEPPISGDADSVNKQRYREARAKASTDPKIVKLRQTLETTAEGAPYKAAAHAYLKALFSKIRKLDPDMGESLKKKEDAYLRRVDAGKPLAD